MKKKFLAIPLLALMFGGAVACSVPSVVCEAHAEEEITEVVEPVEETPEEEASKIKELYEEAMQEIKQLKDNQFVNSLVAVITGGLGSMLVSCLFMFVNRDTMRKCLTALKLGERTLADGTIKVREAMDNNNVVNEKIDKAVSYMEEVDKHAVAVIEKAEFIMANQETIDKKSQETIEELLVIIGSSKELVANGTAEKVYKAFHKE